MNHNLTISAKKPLHILSMILLSIVVMTSMASCDELDDFYPGDIVGNWQEIAPDGGYVYSFYGNGDGWLYDSYYDYYYDFTWEMGDTYLDLYYDDGSYDSYVWSYQGNSLYLYPEYDNSNPIVLQPY